MTFTEEELVQRRNLASRARFHALTDLRRAHPEEFRQCIAEAEKQLPKKKRSSIYSRAETLLTRQFDWEYHLLYAKYAGEAGIGPRSRRDAMFRGIAGVPDVIPAKRRARPHTF